MKELKKIDRQLGHTDSHHPYDHLEMTNMGESQGHSNSNNSYFYQKAVFPSNLNSNNTTNSRMNFNSNSSNNDFHLNLDSHFKSKSSFNPGGSPLKVK